MRIIYVKAEDLTPVKPVLSRLKTVIKPFKTISVYATVQHEKALLEVKEYLLSQGKKAIIGGLLLGCSEPRKTDSDCNLLISTGLFHALNLGVKTQKPVIILNPESRAVRVISKDEVVRYYKQRSLQIGKVLSARTIGIIVSTKPGQENLRLARTARSALIKKGYEAFIFVMNEVNPSSLDNFTSVDAWVNTACPRLIEDEFSKPFINWGELKEHL